MASPPLWTQPELDLLFALRNDGWVYPAIAKEVTRTFGTRRSAESCQNAFTKRQAHEAPKRVVNRVEYVWDSPADELLGIPPRGRSALAQRQRS